MAGAILAGLTHGIRSSRADIATHSIDRFATGDGRYLGTFGQVGSKPGTFYYPMGLAATNDGSLFVNDTMNARVQVFDQAVDAVLPHFW